MSGGDECCKGRRAHVRDGKTEVSFWTLEGLPVLFQFQAVLPLETLVQAESVAGDIGTL